MTLNIPVLIPAYNPPSELTRLVQELLQKGVCQVVVVNDGSTESSQPVFSTLKGILGVDYLEHTANLGKGAALKTGLKFICGK